MLQAGAKSQYPLTTDFTGPVVTRREWPWCGNDNLGCFENILGSLCSFSDSNRTFCSVGTVPCLYCPTRSERCCSAFKYTQCTSAILMPILIKILMPPDANDYHHRAHRVYLQVKLSTGYEFTLACPPGLQVLPTGLELFQRKKLVPEHRGDTWSSLVCLISCAWIGDLQTRTSILKQTSPYKVDMCLNLVKRYVE